MNRKLCFLSAALALSTTAAFAQATAAPVAGAPDLQAIAASAQNAVTAGQAFWSALQALWAVAGPVLTTLGALAHVAPHVNMPSWLEMLAGNYGKAAKTTK